MRRDKGAGPIEYGAVVLLAAAVLAALLAVGLTTKIGASVASAVCTLAGGEDCESSDGSGPGGGPDGGDDDRPDPADTKDGEEDRNGNGIPDGQEDRNNDGIPDGDEDRNDNGTPDGEENRPDGLPHEEDGGNGTLDGDEDRNGNGKKDGDEDRNGDGIPDGEEDRDGDGKPDGDQDRADGLPDEDGGDPQDDEDSEGDGKKDGDQDRDGNGVKDGDEDRDNDGRKDGEEDRNDNGTPDGEEDHPDGLPDEDARDNEDEDSEGNDKKDGDEDSNDNGIPDGEEDRNNNDKPDGDEDRNDNGTPDGDEDNSDGLPEDKDDGNGTPDGDEDRNNNDKPDGDEDLDDDGTPDGQEDRNDNGTPDGDEDNPDGLPENEPGKDDPEVDDPDDVKPDEKSDDEKTKEEEDLIEDSEEFDDLEEYLDIEDIKKCAGVADFRRCLTESLPEADKDFITEVMDWFFGEGPPPPLSIDVVEAIDDAADKMEDFRKERDGDGDDPPEDEKSDDDYPDEESFVEDSPELDAARDQFGAGNVKKCALDKPHDLSFKECLYQARPPGEGGGLFGAPPPPPPPPEPDMIEAANDADKALNKYRDNKDKPKDNDGEDDPDNCETPNSFTAGTRVLMGDGRSAPIEDIEVGDQVLASAPATGEQGPRPVTELIRGQGEKVLVDIEVGGSTLTATDNHPFWVEAENAWVDAADLRPGMVLRSPSGAPSEVGTVDVRVVSDQRVYNLTVGDLHTYFVVGGDGGVLVHNLGCAEDKERSDIEKVIDQKVKDGKYDDADILAREAKFDARDAREKAEKDPTKENKDEADAAEKFAKEQTEKVLKEKLDKAKNDLKSKGKDPVKVTDEAAKGINDDQRELEAADALGDEVVQFNEKFGKNGKRGEVDVETNNALVEVSNGKKVTKENQIKKLVDDTSINPTGKKVVVYAPNWTEKSIRMLKQRLGPDYEGKYEIVTNPKDLKTAAG